MTPNEWCIDGMRQHAIDEAQEAALEKARRERKHALIFPREHGAWGLLLVPMITGAGIAFRESRNVSPFLLLLTAALALFWLRTPLESLLSTSAIRVQTQEERRAVTVVILALGAVAGTVFGHTAVGWPQPCAVADWSSCRGNIRRASSAQEAGTALAHAFRNRRNNRPDVVGRRYLLRNHGKVWSDCLAALAGEPGVRGQSNPLRATQNSYSAGRRQTGEVRLWMDLRGGASRHGRRACVHLPAGAAALDRPHCICAAFVSRMDLLLPEASSAHGAPARLERTDAGSRLLRSVHCGVCPGKVAVPTFPGMCVVDFGIPIMFL